jgi:ABC-type uncharacterized transport system substrate-binding protein
VRSNRCIGAPSSWRRVNQVVAGIGFLAIALFGLPPSSTAQQPEKMLHVGVLALASAKTMQNRLDVFGSSLRELGYENGKNLAFEYRFANGAYDQLPLLAWELARLKVNVFLAQGEPPLLAAKANGDNIPIVVVSCDPLQKLMGSLRRPGGNATGFTCVSSDLVGKRFGLLQSLLPRLKRVGILHNKRDDHELEFVDAEAAALKLGIELVRYGIETSQDFQPTFKRLRDDNCDALYIAASAFSNLYWETLAKLALEHRVPAMYGFREFAHFGGLLSYGANLSDGYRRAAAMVDKIFKGTPPQDLPAEQPTRFELVINAKTARALGIDLPATLIALADEVIE